MLLFVAMAASASPPVAPAPASFAQVGPDGARRLSDVAVRGDGDRTWAVASLDGGVWVTEDAGARWREALAPLATSSADEAVVGEVRARLRELVGPMEDPEEAMLEDHGYLDPDELEDEVDDAEDEARAAAAEATGEVQAELEQQGGSPDPRDRARPRVAFTPAGALVCARADGLRVSADLGSSWELVLDAPVTAFATLADGAFAAGLADGLVLSDDLRSWTRVRAFEGARVTDLGVDGAPWVATTEGAWLGEARGGWVRVDGRGEALTVLPWPDGAVLVATPEGVVRVDAAGGGPTAGGAVPGATRLVRAGDGAVLAASSTGPWRSTDAGRTWAPLPGAGAAEVSDLEARGALLLVAGAEGLLCLDRAGASRSAEGEVRPWLPIGALLAASTRRPELTARPGQRWVAAMLPEVALEGTWDQVLVDTWDADTWTLHGVTGWWGVDGVLTWRPGRQRTTIVVDGEAFADDAEVLVLDGRVVVDDGTAAATLASAVRRSATEYSDQLVEEVGALWSTRERLGALEEAGGGGELVGRVERRLRVEELDARLDALTDGAVSSSTAPRPRGPTPPSGG